MMFFLSRVFLYIPGSSLPIYEINTKYIIICNQQLGGLLGKTLSCLYRKFDVESYRGFRWSWSGIKEFATYFGV